MPIFEWNDRFITRITEIDLQHRSLIDLINKLHDAIAEGHDKEVLGSVLAELVIL
jgi:hemerythrin